MVTVMVLPLNTHVLSKKPKTVNLVLTWVLKSECFKILKSTLPVSRDHDSLHYVIILVDFFLFHVRDKY